MPRSTRSCPICRGQDADTLHTIHYPPSPDRILPTEYRIVVCPDCGMVFDDFDADPAVFKQHYLTQDKYVLPGSAGAGGDSPQDQARWNRTLDFLAPYLKKTSVIADIGCGRGGQLRFFWDRGYTRLCGLDLSPVCIDHIRKNHPFPGICCDPSDFEPEEPFDVILCSQVLEHLFDCAAFLAALKRMLAPEGILYLDVPDASRYRDYQKAPFYFFDQEHINHFQPETLGDLLSRQGFAVRQLIQCENEPVSGFRTPILAAAAEVRDEIAARPLRDYIEKCRAADWPSFPEPLDGKGFLWGVGAHCLRLLNAGAFARLPLAGLIDVAPSQQGRIIHGLRVFSPEVLTLPENRSAFVIITSVLYEDQIRQMLHKQGFSGQILSVNRLGERQ